MRGTFRTIALSSAMFASATSLAQTAVQRPVFKEDGSVEAPAFTLPPSPFWSPEALERQKQKAKAPQAGSIFDLDIQGARKAIEMALGPQADEARRRYPVKIEERSIGGIPVRVVTPANKAFDQKRVLINIHGGAYSMCAQACAIIESTPIAALGGFKVISVDYRMAPEVQHPASVEDVASVYRELLKDYRPGQIGIYGCSAGGGLTARVAAWLATHGLPQAGAIGIFGSGAGNRRGAGDSAYFAGLVDGSLPIPGTSRGDPSRGYFSKADPDDPVAYPDRHPEVLRRFPPTLIITGTRAADLSAAAVTNSGLIKAGVRSTMIVGEGMNHCYIYDSTLPESQDAFQAIVNFFRENLR